MPDKGKTKILLRIRDKSGFLYMALNILLVCGGDGAEHEISLISADYILKCLQANPNFNVIYACLHQGKYLLKDGTVATLGEDATLTTPQGVIKIDCAVPCLHGTPGETGDIQSYFKLLHVPYIGCGPEASQRCFDKVTTKLYLSALGIPNSPYIWLNNLNETALKAAHAFFLVHQDVYVKAASQGSSVGCYHVTKLEDLDDTIAQAFTFSDTVLIEKNIVHRELEVAAYEIDGKLVVTNPGEIIMPQNVFYTYEEKYSKNSGTVTTVQPQGLSDSQKQHIRQLAEQAFKALKLRDLSRIDFFLSDSGEILINEINTFPGMTPISMFPKLLEHHGDKMTAFLSGCIERALARKAQGQY